ncbi:AAA family ATPase [Nocardioides sp.]|uniref:ATP-binding protein n=1 Tax=Nocardioides sp. TaxID=35761 RepID=UPI0035AEB50B
MGALPRPDLAPGPVRTLNDALHDLHHQAGWPSLRTLARETGVSHTTVSKTFSRPALPAWGTLELLVEAMDGDTTTFHDLWLAATTPTNGDRPTAPRIAGRRAELDVVRHHLETGTGLLLVTGEAGIGKTTLIEAAAASTEAFVAGGQCLPLSTVIPLLPVADVLRAVHGARDGAWLRDALGRCAPYVTASVSALLPEIQSSSDLPGRTGDQGLLFAAVAAVVEALCEDRPLALQIEDLHWADPMTLDLVEYLLGRSVSVPVVGTWRRGDPGTPVASEEWLVRVRRRLPAASVMELGPLSRDETADQLALLGTVEVETIDTIHARSRGQPLFTEQLAVQLDEGDGLPSLLLDLLDRRLAGTSEESWSVLRVLGAAARPVRPAVLAEAVGVDADTLTRRVRELRERLLLRRVGEAIELQHPLLAEAVQQRLVAGEDQAVHRAVGQALAATPDAEPAEVAEHFQRAGLPEPELQWRISAARAAARRYDRGREAEHWLRALEVWPDDASPDVDPPITRAGAYLEAMDGLRFSLQWDRAAAMSDQAGDVLGDVDDAVRAELLWRAAEFRGQREGASVARALIDESLRLFEHVPLCSGTLHALDWRVNLLEAAGRFDEARDALQAKLAAAEALGDRIVLRDCVMDAAWHAGVEGRTDEAVRMLAGSKQRAGLSLDPLGDLRQAVAATDVLLINGRPLAAVADLAHGGFAVADEHGIANPQVAILHINLAIALLRAGRIDAAEDEIGIGRSEPVDVGRFHLHGLRAAVDSARGAHQAAQDRLAAIWATVAGNLETDLELLVTAGSVGCWADEPEPARTRLLRALDLVAGGTPIRVVAPALVVAARCVAHQAGSETGADRAGRDREALRALADKAGLLSDHAGDHNLGAHRAAFEAELARCEDRATVDAWVQAAAGWDGLGRPHNAGYARWRAAQCALRERQGTVAARLLKRAAADAREHVPLSRAIAGTAAG